MAYFQISADRLKYVVKAADEASALGRFNKTNPTVDPPIKDLDTEDFSLLTNLNINTYIVRNSLGQRIFISANTQLEAISIYNTAFPLSQIKACNKANGYNFELVNEAAAVSKTFYVTHHYGDSNSDYKSSTIAKHAADLVYMGANGSRNGFRQIYGDNLFRENGTIFSQWLDALIANNLKMMPVISASWSYRSPATTTADFTARKNSTGFTKAQYDLLQSDGYTMGRNFMLNLGSKADYISHIHYGSEQDVIEPRSELQSNGGSSGVNPPPEGLYDDVSKTYIWTSSTNTTTGNIIYPMHYFGCLLYGTAGFIRGVWSVKPDLDLIINFSSYHYGLASRWASELKRVCGIDVANKLIIGADIYSDVENSNDATGTFVKKVNGKPASVPYSLSTTARMKYFFKDKGLCKGHMITETGFNTTKGSLWPSQDLFYKNTTLPQLLDPDCLGVCLYEAENEVLTRASDPDPAERSYGYTQASKDMWRLAVKGLPPA